MYTHTHTHLKISISGRKLIHSITAVRRRVLDVPAALFHMLRALGQHRNAAATATAAASGVATAAAGTGVAAKRSAISAVIQRERFLRRVGKHEVVVRLDLLGCFELHHHVILVRHRHGGLDCRGHGFDAYLASLYAAVEPLNTRHVAALVDLRCAQVSKEASFDVFLF